MEGLKVIQQFSLCSPKRSKEHYSSSTRPLWGFHSAWTLKDTQPAGWGEVTSFIFGVKIQTCHCFKAKWRLEHFVCQVWLVFDFLFFILTIQGVLTSIQSESVRPAMFQPAVFTFKPKSKLDLELIVFGRFHLESPALRHTHQRGVCFRLY